MAGDSFPSRHHPAHHLWVLSWSSINVYGVWSFELETKGSMWVWSQDREGAFPPWGGDCLSSNAALDQVDHIQLVKLNHTRHVINS